MLSSNSPITIPGLPDSAVYHYHAVADELAPIGPARETLKQWCAAGVVVTNQEDLVGEHLSEVATGVPGALAYLKSSFAGTAPRNDCARIP